MGLLATTFYTFLPCFFFVFAGAPLVERTQDNPIIRGVLELITAVVVGAILDLALFLGKAVIFPSGVAGLKQLNLISLSGVILSLLLVQRFKLKVIPLILLGIGVGAVRCSWAFEGPSTKLPDGRRTGSNLRLPSRRTAGMLIGSFSPS